MLTLLSIENIAVIEKAEIEFDRGFNVLTGETGAGKSIVIDSLEAALGWRTSSQLVRRGADSAKVTAVFTPEGTEDFCRENGIDLEEELILTRRISPEGKSSCRINGTPVPAAVMRQLGLLLIDIHGQSDGQRITDERYHRQYLDSFGSYGELMADYKKAYDEYSAVRRELSELDMDESEKARRVDMLTYQIGEIERANLTPGEYDEKSKRRDFLKSAGKLTSAVESATASIFGGDRSDGALNLISAALDEINYAARLSDEFGAIGAKLQELKFSCEDVAYELRDMSDKLDFSPQELDELDDRLDQLKRIFRKYGGDEEEALNYLERSKEELEQIEYSEERLIKLQNQLSILESKARDKAKALSKARTDTGNELSKLIEAELHSLSMSGARFTVEVTQDDALTSQGIDTVRFLIAANAGEEMGRIVKVASGGELSRIMLAIKTVLSSGDPVDAMVFDEIDTGVSGIAARRVSEKLAAVSRKKQVICVTHLPQIAAMADTHFSIEKREENGRTYTSVIKLTEEGRAQELSRLMSGDVVTDSSLTAAREQLDSAAEYKRSDLS